MAEKKEQNDQKKYSEVYVREKNESKTVKISSKIKPEISTPILKKWQSLLNTVAKIVDVPSALIMRLNEKSIEVFLKSHTEGNPYEVGEEAKLIYGLYCENVIGTQERLLIPDATKSKVWKDNNPDVDINMISYMGFPINWPDGEVFGTVCLLDDNENEYNDNYSELLNQVKLHIETDLEQLVIQQELEEKNKILEQMNDTKLRFLSLISHDIRGGIGTLDELLKFIIENLEHYDKQKIKTILKTLSESAGYSYQMLDNLLNWSKNDLIGLHPDKTNYDVISQIESLLRYFSQSVSMKNIKIEKFYAKEKILIYADVNMIKVSLRNILSNAVKYTNKGGTITINVNDYNNNQTIEIEDTGVGMDQQLVKKLFSYNNGFSKQGTDGEESSGIGLMITKEFLDKNGAKVEVNSVPEHGTRFKIYFESDDNNFLKSV